MYPLQYEIEVMPYTVGGGPYGHGELMPGRTVRVFSWAVVAGNSVETKEGNAIYLRTTERLQVIAPAGSFRTPAPNESLEQVEVKGSKWTLTGTEETHDNGPWWTPNMAVYTFENEVGDYLLPPDIDPEDVPDPVDPDTNPEDIPAYAYNPYADGDNPKYEQGAGGPYGGPNFFAGDDYNPYADKNSPFYTLGAGLEDPYGDPSGPIPAGTEWPEGQSAEARNAYQATLGNVG